MEQVTATAKGTLDTLNQAQGQGASKVMDGSHSDVCEKHKTPLFLLHDGRFICEKCSEERREKEKVEAGVRAKSEGAHAQLALPLRLQGCSFENYESVETSWQNMKKCLEYVDNWPNVGGIVMIGGVGTGKTHLAVSICKALCDKGVHCHISTVTRIIREVRSSWKNKTNETEQEIINRYADHGMLVIDEVGVQYGSDSEKITITEIINDRYEQKKPTVLIGNLDREQLIEAMGARVVDRVIHDGLKLQFNWKSYRS